MMATVYNNCKQEGNGIPPTGRTAGVPTPGRRPTTLDAPSMASDRSVPPVVAVVVTRQPAPWLEETLHAMGAQDYPNLSVIVIDASAAPAPGPDLASRVAAALPGAYLRGMAQPASWGAAANEVIGVVDGASHYLLCHDDVAPDPQALRLMVEEAFRSNAGIVTPKLVDWDDQRRLLVVGASVDRVGVLQPLVERGELDQGQHDAARDVFVAPGGAVLVRADLFEALGGYDASVPEGGENLDLSWRALLAGARVRVAPAARVRHREGAGCGLATQVDAPSGVAPGEDRYRFHVLLACLGAVTLVWAYPLAVVFALAEALAALVTGEPGRAASLAAGPWRPWAHPVRLWHSRCRAQRRRAVRDHRLRSFQVGGNGRFRAWIAGLAERDAATAWQGLAVGPLEALEVGSDPTPQGELAQRGRARVRAAMAGDQLLGDAPGGPPAGGGDVEADRHSPDATGADVLTGPAAVQVRTAATAGRGSVTTAVVGLLAVFLVGSRGLLLNPLPHIGLIPNLSGGIGSWWRAWVSTWQPAGVGSTAPGAPALGLLSLAGILFVGATGTLEHVLVLAPLLVGPLGAYRLARPWGTGWARAGALIAYAACPVAYGALEWGRWDALVVYAAAPWALAGLGRLSDALPYPRVQGRRLAGQLCLLGLLTALTASVAPSWLIVLPVVAAALAGGSLLAGQSPVAGRLLAVGAITGGVGFVLLCPWSAVVIIHRAALFGAPWGGRHPGVAGLLRFHVGSVGGSPLEWGLLAAAASPLLIGRSWRLAWAIRLWTVVVVAVAWAYLAGLGLLPGPAPAVLLAPAAAALSGCVALGVVAFQQDLPGYRFGWRQAVSAAAAAGLALTVFPVLVAATGGRWGMPSSGPSAVLGSLNRLPGGGYRVLWVGDPRAIPEASVPLGHGQAWATSLDGLPAVTYTWLDGAAGAGATISRDLRLAQTGLTTRLGHLLAPLGVRFVVVPRADAPSQSGERPVPVPVALLRGLPLQTDLETVGSDSRYVVYANAAWWPVEATVPAGTVLAARPTLRQLGVTELGRARPALTSVSPTRATGRLGGPLQVYVAAGPGGRWRLRVGATALRGRRALDVGTSFAVPAGVAGPAVLAAGVEPWLRVVQWVAALLWLAALAVVFTSRRAGSERDGVRPEWFQPLAPMRPSLRRAPRRPVAAEAPADEEVWADG